MNAFSYRIQNLQPSAIREILKQTASPDIIPFAAGNPAPEAFPVEKIREISNQLLTESPIDVLQYSISEGYTPLRDWIKGNLEKKHLFKKGVDNVITTSGAQQAIELTTKCFCNEGDTIICEDPSFIGSLNTFRSYGARLVGVPMESDGMDLDRLEAALIKNRRTAFIYTIPNFQNPTGITMSLEKREALLELAYKYHVMILEDNPYGDLRFSGEDVPSLKELDTRGQVIYAGTFSKTLAPGLRVGFMCAPDSIVQKAVCGLQVSTVHTNIWAQQIAHKFVTTVDWEAHLEGLRAIYKRKSNLMINSLKFNLPLSISITEPEGGLFLWGTLPDGDMLYFVKKCIEKKVAVVPGTAFLTDEKASSLSFRVNFSTPTDKQIEDGAVILGEVAKTMYK